MRTILIVDDDEDFHEAVEAAVARRGFCVQHAGNGREALQRLEAARPDAILIDLMMPGMDGWQLLEALEQQPDLAAIPAAVMSASPNRSGLPARVGHLPKPCDLRDLLDLLDRMCGQG
jgi:CheY-like chemotaxis protein